MMNQINTGISTNSIENYNPSSNTEECFNCIPSPINYRIPERFYNSSEFFCEFNQIKECGNILIEPSTNTECATSIIDVQPELKVKTIDSQTFDFLYFILFASEKNIKSANNFIEEVKSVIEPLIVKDKEIEALNVVFEKFDDELTDKKFDFIQTVLNQISFNSFSLKFLIGILSVTNPWKIQLNPAREAFLARIEKTAAKELGEERVSKILSGLR